MTKLADVVFGLWRARPFEVLSPLSVEEVRRRITASVSGRVGPYAEIIRSDGEIVAGRFDGDVFALVTRRPSRTFLGGWRPVLRGRLVEDAEGCRLLCRASWLRPAQVIAALWIGVAVAGVLFSGPPFPLNLFAAFGLAVLGCVVVSLSRLAYRDEDDYLRAWLVRATEAPA